MWWNSSILSSDLYSDAPNLVKEKTIYFSSKWKVIFWFFLVIDGVNTKTEQTIQKDLRLIKCQRFMSINRP